jgi:hypothetical protein
MNVLAAMVMPLLALMGAVDDRAVTTMIAEVASTAPNTEVVTTADVNQLLELQGQKQAAGCADDSDSCVAELATALGAELVIRGELGMLDGGRRLNITVLNTTRIGATRRAFLQAPSTTALADELKQRLPALIAGARTTDGTVRIFVVDVAENDPQIVDRNTPSAPSAPLPWQVPVGGVLGGVGVVGLGAAVVAEVVVGGLNTSLASTGADELDQVAAVAALSTRDQWALAGKVGWIVGAVGVAAGGAVLASSLMGSE